RRSGWLSTGHGGADQQHQGRPRVATAAPGPGICHPLDHLCPRPARRAGCATLTPVHRVPPSLSILCLEDTRSPSLLTYLTEDFDITLGVRKHIFIHEADC